MKIVSCRFLRNFLSDFPFRNARQNHICYGACVLSINLSLMIFRFSNSPILNVFRGKKFKKNWNFAGRKADEPHILALDYFDLVYPAIYHSIYPSIRLSLLSLPKYAAVVNNDSSFNRTSAELMSLGAYDFLKLGPELSENSDLFREMNVEMDLSSRAEDVLPAHEGLKLPIALKAYVFDNGDVSRFPEPGMCGNPD